MTLILCSRIYFEYDDDDDLVLRKQQIEQNVKIEMFAAHRIHQNARASHFDSVGPNSLPSMRFDSIPNVRT